MQLQSDLRHFNFHYGYNCKCLENSDLCFYTYLNDLQALLEGCNFESYCQYLEKKIYYLNSNIILNNNVNLMKFNVAGHKLNFIEKKC